jgi:hypothetical protein
VAESGVREETAEIKNQKSKIKNQKCGVARQAVPSFFF